MHVLSKLWAVAALAGAAIASADITPVNNLVARALESRHDKQPECKDLKIAVFVKGKRFQKAHWLEIKNGDGQVAKEYKDADSFALDCEGHLTYCGKPVTLEFCNGYAVWKVGKKGKESKDIKFVHGKQVLSVEGDHFKKGTEGNVCISKDNSVFVGEKGCHTPFSCYDIWLVPVCLDKYKEEPSKDEPCDEDKSSPSDDKPCPEDKPSSDEPCPEDDSPSDEPCPEDHPSHPEEPCDDDHPSHPDEPCDDDHPSHPDEPCDDDHPSHPDEPCDDDHPTPTHPPCPDPSSDPDHDDHHHDEPCEEEDDHHHHRRW